MTILCACCSQKWPGLIATERELCRPCRDWVWPDLAAPPPVKKKRRLRWISVEDQVTELRAHAARIRECDKDYGTGIFLTTDSDFRGLAGELVYARHFGLPFEYRFIPGGDKGEDFRRDGLRIDVKTSSRVASPDLFVKTPVKRWADRYALVVLDTRTMSGAVWGEIDADVVKRAPKKRLRPDYPLNHVVAGRDVPPVEYTVLAADGWRHRWEGDRAVTQAG